MPKYCTDNKSQHPARCFKGTERSFKGTETVARPVVSKVVTPGVCVCVAQRHSYLPLALRFAWHCPSGTDLQTPASGIYLLKMAFIKGY